jgi:hypothetical protein
MPPGKTLVAGRDYRRDGPKTGIGPILDGKWTPTATLPSGGDNSYPGIFWNLGKWWVSYDSIHEGKSAINLARIRGI